MHDADYDHDDRYADDEESERVAEEIFAGVLAGPGFEPDPLGERGPLKDGYRLKLGRRWFGSLEQPYFLRFPRTYAVWAYGKAGMVVAGPFLFSSFEEAGRFLNEYARLRKHRRFGKQGMLEIADYLGRN